MSGQVFFNEVRNKVVEVKTLRVRVLAQTFVKENKFIFVDRDDHQFLLELYPHQDQLWEQNSFGQVKAKNGCNAVNAYLS